MFSFKSVYFVIFNLIWCQALAEISDKRLCIDENCSEIVAFGKTLLRYSSPDHDILSFGPNEDVTIYSYGAGKKSDLIGVELKGKRGYVNKHHIRETRLVKRPKLLVDTEVAKDNTKVPLEGAASDIKADKSQEFEIVDGTKIWLEPATEVPPVNSVEEESNILPTQPLNTVPENENVNQLPKLSDENLKEQEPKLKKEMEEEEDNDEEDDTNDDDEDDDDEEPEDPDRDPEDIKEKKLDSDQKVQKKESHIYFEESVQNVTDGAPSIANTENIIETDNKENDDVNSEPKETSEKLENVTSTDPIETVVSVITENNKSSKNIQNASSISELILNGSEVQSSSEIKPPDSLQQKPENMGINILNITNSSAETKIDELPLIQSPHEEQTTKNNTEEKQESKPSPADTSLPEHATEIPLEIDILSPIEPDYVTPNPAADAKNGQTEDPVTKYNLPSDLTPEFKDPEESKINEPTLGDGQKVAESKTNINELSNEDPLEDTPNSSENSGLNSDAELTAEIERKLQSESTGGFLSDIMSFFGMGSEGEASTDKLIENNFEATQESEIPQHHSPWSSDNTEQQVEETLKTCDSKSENCPEIAKQGSCDKENEDCPAQEPKTSIPPPQEEELSKKFSVEYIEEVLVETFSSDMFLYLFTTSVSVLVLIFIWIVLDKCRREGPLIARINKLEQQLLATSKENEMLQEKATLFVEEKTQLVVETVPNEVVDELTAKLIEANNTKLALEEQIQALEKELDTSTEVGIELNKIISEMLNSTDGSEILKENVEQMQKKLLEQQDRINSLNESLNVKETEIYELRLELEISNKKVAELQSEVDKMVEKILRIEEERDQQHKTLESDLAMYQNKCKEALTQEHVLKSEIINLNQKVAELQRLADTKIKEYDTLKETLKTIKTVKNDKDALKSFLDVSEVKAQVEQLKSENIKYSEQLSQERGANISYTNQIQTLSKEVQELREKYEKADKEKVEINTKLEVLNNYFKEKEDQMQKEISKYESLWVAKEGEATSTTERIRYMQEELQNYRTQNESLKQEIVNQEVELKSQISMLEKKSHENWVTNRQTERKLEEAKQEAALLRNRLTLRERAITEGHNQIRMQSPLHQNGELPLSPPPLDPTQSPPPLFNPLDRMTKSPPIPGLPPPFLPPRLGVTPFIPPPPLDGIMPPSIGDLGGLPPFIPGLHSGMFPGDHRPPPLGRMSSPPPVGGRYSPESTVYSEYDRYDRRSPSPPYDSEYGASPPPIRGYSPYDDRDRVRDDRRAYKRPQPRSNGRNSKGIHSSGSENDSLGKTNKKPQRKV